MAKKPFDIMSTLNPQSIQGGEHAASEFVVEMIPLEEIEPNADNFYSVANIQDLADDIRVNGLMHNIVVCGTGDGKYKLVSGERRYRAFALLNEQGVEGYGAIPVMIDPEENPLKVRLKLISANATARVLSDYEKSEQVAQIEGIVKQLKQEGAELPGRVREIAAQALGVSTAQVGRLEKINRDLVPEVKEKFSAGDISHEYRFGEIMAQIKSYPNNANVEIGAENVMRWHHGRTSGVFGAQGNLAVAPLASPAMAVTVSDGDGWLADANKNGIHFWNDKFSATAALLQLAIDTADGVLGRIDRIIVEWSIPNYTQLPEIKVLKGTNAIAPVPPALTNDAATRQISLAKITIAAGTLAITAGMINDERMQAAVCGIVTESTVVDTSMATAQFEEILNEAQEFLEDLQGGAIVNHAATHEPGGDDGLRFVFYGGAQALNDEQKAQARTNVSAEPSRLQFINTVVDNAAFVADATYTDFPFRATVALTGVLNTMVPHVVFGAEDAISGVFAPVAAVYNGGVYLYASEVPAADITVPTIICWR